MQSRGAVAISARYVEPGARGLMVRMLFLRLVLPSYYGYAFEIAPLG
jgi:hypothetical protein